MVILNVFTGRSKLTQKHGKRRALNNDTRATLSNVSNDHSMSSNREPQSDEATGKDGAASDLAQCLDLTGAETHNSRRIRITCPQQHS